MSQNCVKILAVISGTRRKTGLLCNLNTLRSHTTLWKGNVCFHSSCSATKLILLLRYYFWALAKHPGMFVDTVLAEIQWKHACPAVWSISAVVNRNNTIVATQPVACVYMLKQDSRTHVQDVSRWDRKILKSQWRDRRIQVVIERLCAVEQQQWKQHPMKGTVCLYFVRMALQIFCEHFFFFWKDRSTLPPSKTTITHWLNTQNIEERKLFGWQKSQL